MLCFFVDWQDKWMMLCVSDLDPDPLTKDEDLTPEVAAEVGTGGGELKSQFFFSTLNLNFSCFRIHIVVHSFLFIVSLNLQFLVKWKNYSDICIDWIITSEMLSYGIISCRSRSASGDRRRSRSRSASKSRSRSRSISRSKSRSPINEGGDAKAGSRSRSPPSDHE